MGLYRRKGLVVFAAWEADGGIPVLWRGWVIDPAMLTFSPWPILVSVPIAGIGAIPTGTGAMEDRGIGSMLIGGTALKEGLVPITGLALIWFRVSG